MNQLPIKKIVYVAILVFIAIMTFFFFIKKDGYKKGGIEKNPQEKIIESKNKIENWNSVLNSVDKKLNSDISSQFSIDERNRLENEKKIVSQQVIAEKRNLAFAYYSVNDLDSAESFINEAIAANENDSQYYVDLGNIYQTKGDKKSAEEMFKKAIGLVHDASVGVVSSEYENIPSQSITIPTLKNVSKTSRDIIISEKDKNSGNIIPTPFISLARLYVEEEKIDLAIETLKEGITYLNTYPDFYLMLSELYNSKKNLENASFYRREFENLLKN